MIKHQSYTKAAPNRTDPKERWQDKGACAAPEAENVREIFFAHERDKAAVREAQVLCHGCPVQAECADWALTEPEQFGIWGGLTERQRRTILRKRRKQRAAA